MGHASVQSIAALRVHKTGQEVYKKTANLSTLVDTLWKVACRVPVVAAHGALLWVFALHRWPVGPVPVCLSFAACID